MKAWLIPISLSMAVPLLGGTAHADQCQWLTKAQAEKAQQILTSSSKYIDYCEPCGDQAPSIPQRIENANVMVPAASYWEVSINGKPSDLAYVFVKTSDSHYQNLAMLAGCPVSDVSPSLSIDAETTNGVLIHADDYKPAVEPEPMTAVTTIPSYVPPAPPPPPPQVFVYSTTTRDVSWLALLLAASGGAITGSALTIALLAVRRRRAMRPRAVDISARAE